ncbi:transposase [Faecalibacter bovis]|uniref:Transposase n=1 Tax=Faecalibacter bovis TaxID=2898187 RepID=A0ABX7XBT1_9FLAO|nr:transposase [Faecalibacter bovis]QTV05353.1 transposase [Faecalibacter bovis]
MEQYNPYKHHRKSIRLIGYDYSQAGLYFVTLVCQDRAHLFGDIKDGIMYLNEFGQLVADEWLHTQAVRYNVVIHEFIVMPNHIHGIIEILYPKESSNIVGALKSPSQTIGAIVRGYKIATIKRIKELIKRTEDNKGEDSKGELQFAPTAPTFPTNPTREIIKSLDYKIWQRNYYEHIIRDEKAFINISNYIIENPKRWINDEYNLSQ